MIDTRGKSVSALQQMSLFRPIVPTPRWSELSPELRQSVIRLLAALLQQQSQRAVAQGEEEAVDE